MIAPCKGCTSRHMACHDQCERYKEYRKYLDEINERRKAYNEVNADAEAVYQTARDRWMREHNRRR